MLRLLLTCEHGGNRVPSEHTHLFESPEARAALDSHRGWDPGSLEIHRALVRAFPEAGAFRSTVTRLLVDLNRSPSNPACFSEWTRGLPREEREALLREFHEPHRRAVEDWIREALAAMLGRASRGGSAGLAAEGGGTSERGASGVERAAGVLHIGVHTFTPVLNGRERDLDVGLLYDPDRAGEKGFAARWKAALEEVLPDLRIGRNRPYRGDADGLTTALRSVFPQSYLGVEIEIGQALVPEPRAAERIGGRIAEALAEALG